MSSFGGVEEKCESNEVSINISKRVKVLERSIQEASLEAWKYASYDESLEMTETNVAVEDDDDLCQYLFREDASIIQKELQDRLERMEEEVSTCLSSQQQDPNNNNNNETSILKNWKWKVSFLQDVTQARIALQEVTSMIQEGEKKNTGLLVHAATQIQTAQSHLASAEKRLSSSSTNDDGNKEEEIQMAHSILQAVRKPLQRTRIDLLSSIGQKYEDGHIIQQNQLSIMEDTSQWLQIMDSNRLLLSLSQHHQQKQPDSSSEMEFAQRIYQDIFHPILTQHEEYCNRINNNNNNIQSEPNTSWQMRETKTRNKNNTSMITLEWRQRTTTSTQSQMEQDQPTQTDNNNDTNDSPHDLHTTNNCIDSFLEVLQFLQHVCQFIHNNFLLKQTNLSQLVGSVWFGYDDKDEESNARSPHKNTLWKKLQSHLSHLLWSTCLPNTNDTIQVWNAITETWKVKLVDALSEFEACLLKCGFILPNEEMTWPLLLFAQQYERRHGEKQQSIILQQGRQLLLKNDYHNTVQVGVDVRANASKDNQDRPEELESMNIFLLHQCNVSQLVQELLSMCHRTMKLSVKCHKELSSLERNDKKTNELSFLPPLLYRATRELLELFRAIIPAAHGNEISTIPRTAAIHYNDCVYLAHEMLTFGLEFRDEFESNTSNAMNDFPPSLCTFVDLVPPFRELAERTMRDMIERQKHILCEIVQERIGQNHQVLASVLKCNEPVVEWKDAETALHAGIYHLRHLSQAWKTPILSHDIYGRVMGNLVDTLFILFLEPVQKSRDISEPACHFISSLYSNAILNATTLFVEDETISNHSDSTDGDSTARMYSKMWSKFVAIGKFMDMSLTDIQFALTEGIFRSVTGPELSSLILAVFEETEKRKQMLQLLAPDKY